jgi:hypothetical protein
LNRKGHTAWNKGIKFSREHKRKLLLAHKGQIVTEKTRSKLSEALKTFWLIPKNKEKMSQVHIEWWQKKKKT